MNSVEWNPKYNLLAYAGDDKNKYQADEGIAASCYGVIIRDVNILIVEESISTKWDPEYEKTRLIHRPVLFVAGIFRIFGFESA